MKLELKRISDYQPPAKIEKPSLLKNSIPFGIAVIICGISFLLAFLSDIFIFLTSVFIVLGVPISLLVTWSVYSKELSDYKNWAKQTSDIVAYKNSQKAEIQQKYNGILNTYLSNEISDRRCKEESDEIFVRGLYKSSSILLQCNKCGSINIVRLKQPEKAYDLAIRENSLLILRPITTELKWMCKDCGHKF